MENINKILVTTPINPSEEIIQKSKELASDLKAIYCERKKNTLNYLTNRYRVESALLFDGIKIRLVHNKKSFEFHPNMALLRIESLKNGKNDRYIDLAKIEPGDKVLDCTCGLASDAIVASYVTGKTGSVTALEASAILSNIVKYGLQNYSHKKEAINSAMRRIEIVNCNYNDYLKSLESNSYDIVYLDPMFKKTRYKAQGLDIVRNLGCYNLPTKANLNEARRVARKHVIIKDSAPGLFLKSMNITVISKARKIWYGILK